MWTCRHSAHRRIRSVWASAFSRTAVQPRHRAFGALLEQQWHAFGCRVDGIQDHVFLMTRRTRQYIVDHLGLVAGMADAEAHAPELGAHVRDHITHAVVAA